MYLEDLSHEARELALYMDNDHATYRHVGAVDANMARHYVRGTYDLERAIRGYRYAVDAAAKRYHAEHGSMWDAWHRVFPLADRERVAELYAQAFPRIAREPRLWGDLQDEARRVLERDAAKRARAAS